MTALQKLANWYLQVSWWWAAAFWVAAVSSVARGNLWWCLFFAVMGAIETHKCVCGVVNKPLGRISGAIFGALLLLSIAAGVVLVAAA